ncbi:MULTISPECIES: hypothetical protein [Micromonospora]|uniref:Uncharacterized protein n=1 Tax=Micromonospora solifontis TaxID=2487138 RepID=A0ABX9W9N8_9ACTN|nr:MULTISPECIES: hypothetical protein [Micromonospora]NES16609.1 hypothetical protein [Micromonospora sp. PPF5-17B]NES39240.1 hypothetical protein [Micromonospora solifontis]NES58388.1 hypothetical protein [Micromonospora sp. PPF5-6]RNL89825.1 hypothetical protein EFE23_24375 [Micromonospora solifontis]
MADDTELTIALAEYEHLRELSRAVHDQSAARFTFFLAVASGATAVSAGLITTGTPPGPVGPAVLAGLGLLVLLLGVFVFARQVELNDRGRRYAVAATVLRTYLTRRAPELAPFIVMPTLDDPGPFAPEPFRRHWFRDLVSQAGMLALVNSVLVGLAVALAALAADAARLAGPAAALVVAASIAAHLRIIRRRVARSAGQVGAVLDRRSLTVAHPMPAGDEAA